MPSRNWRGDPEVVNRYCSSFLESCSWVSKLFEFVSISFPDMVSLSIKGTAGYLVLTNILITKQHLELTLNLAMFCTLLSIIVMLPLVCGWGGHVYIFFFPLLSSITVVNTVSISLQIFSQNYPVRKVQLLLWFCRWENCSTMKLKYLALSHSADLRFKPTPSDSKSKAFNY